MVSSRAIKLTKILGSQDATKISLVSAFLGNQPAIERVVIENEFAALQKDGGLYFEYNTEWEEDQHDNNIVVAAVLDPLSEPAQDKSVVDLHSGHIKGERLTVLNYNHDMMMRRP